MNKEKAIIIIGPTSSGKSDLAIKMAQELGGEIISVDSRQVFRGMDIGTGKVTPREQSLVPHHMLDICEPGMNYNVQDFLHDAGIVELSIRKRGNVPIFCGGSLFWMESYLSETTFPAVPPNKSLRDTLGELSSDELFLLLREKDPERATTIDPQNKVRLIRALEIIESQGQVPKLGSADIQSAQEKYRIIAITPERDILRARIQKRLDARFRAGMIDEARGLITQGISPQWLERIGLEYKYISLFLRGELTEQEMHEQLFFAIWHYAKRQMTWLRKMKTKGFVIEWRE